MDDPSVVPVLVRAWIRHAAQGHILSPDPDQGGDFPMAGQGVVVVGSDGLAQEYVAAIINDLLRQPTFRETYAKKEPLADSWLRWFAAGEVHNITRSDNAWDALIRPQLLVVTGLPNDDKWQIKNVYNVLAQRQRMSKPTMLTMSYDTHSALVPPTVEMASLDSSLAELVASQLLVVL